MTCPLSAPHRWLFHIHSFNPPMMTREVLLLRWKARLCLFTLSVSTMQMMSPAANESPSFTSHSVMVPTSIVFTGKRRERRERRRWRQEALRKDWISSKMAEIIKHRLLKRQSNQQANPSRRLGRNRHISAELRSTERRGRICPEIALFLPTIRHAECTISPFPQSTPMGISDTREACLSERAIYMGECLVTSFCYHLCTLTLGFDLSLPVGHRLRALLRERTMSTKEGAEGFPAYLLRMYLTGERAGSPTTSCSGNPELK